MSIRVLHVVTYMGRGGLETMIMNYYRHIDRSKVQFDFLVHREFEADYDQEILELGGCIYRLPQLNPFSKNYLTKLDAFFKEHTEYKIVHCHLDCMAGIPLKYAKKNGVPVRIAHAHNSNQTKDKKYLLKLLYKMNIRKYANKLFACGEKAGKWMFGRHVNFSILNNAIDTQKYIYKPWVAMEKKKELGISKEAFVVGHVGRFAPPKNHTFIIEIFHELLKVRPEAKLLLVGEGSLKEGIQEKVKSLEIQDKVIFTGVRADVPELLQVMDVFLFPSIYEGLPVSIIEAQAAGLPCLISDKVPIECKKTDLVQQIGLEEDISVWVTAINQFYEGEHEDTSKKIKDAGFDVTENAKWLENLYLTSCEKETER